MDDHHAQQRFHVDVVRVRGERIPEEDDEINLAFGDSCADLLIAADRTTAEAMHAMRLRRAVINELKGIPDTLI